MYPVTINIYVTKVYSGIYNSCPYVFLPSDIELGKRDIELKFCKKSLFNLLIKFMDLLKMTKGSKFNDFIEGKGRKF